MRRFSSICSSAYRLRQRHQQQTSGFRLLSTLTAEHGLLSAQPLACHSSSVGQRSYSNQVPPPPKKNLFENFFDNVREELKRNKELQEQKNVLDAKIKEMAESQALKDARAKFEVVEKETVKSSELVKKKLDDLRDQMSKMIAEVQKTDAGKKISEAGEAVLKKTREAAETIEKTAQALGDTAVYQHVSSSMKTVKDEIDQIADVRMYSRPEELHMRTQQFSSTDASNRQFEPNTEATGMQLHKDSRWYQSWKSFSENNAYFNKLLDWKMKYDESEHPLLRLARGITERVSEALSGQTVVSEVLTEITKVDPGFEKTEWLRFVEKQIIPNVLEAKIRSNFEVLKDWCYERAFNQLSFPLKEMKKIGFSMKDSRIIDIAKLELVGGKMMPEGPMLIISFYSYVLEVVRNSEGKLVEGSTEKPARYRNLWILCRDMEELNPVVAWKVMEVHEVKEELTL